MIHISSQIKIKKHQKIQPTVIYVESTGSHRKISTNEEEGKGK